MFRHMWFIFSEKINEEYKEQYVQYVQTAF